MSQPLTSSMLYQELNPSFDLMPYIVKYYNVSGFTSPENPYEEFTLPNGYTSLVFHLGEKINVSHVKYDGNNIERHYFFGKYTRPIFVHHSFGKADVFGVIFRPGALKYFTCISQREFTDKLENVCDVLGGPFCDIVKRLEDSTYSQDQWPAKMERLIQFRKDLIEPYFIGLLKYQKLECNFIDTIIGNILSNPRSVSIKGLSKKFKVSEQYLNREFNKRIGMSTVKYARIIRFNYLSHSFTSSHFENLEQLAFDFEYVDASHLIKDFKLFTGGKPSDFLSKNNDLAKFLLHT